jgi:hypothetical protein
MLTVGQLDRKSAAAARSTLKKDTPKNKATTIANARALIFSPNFQVCMTPAE